MDLNDIASDPKVIGIFNSAIGLFFVAFGIMRLKRVGKDQCTVPAQAVIHEISNSYDDDPGNGYMVIRFADKDVNWITVKLNESSALYSKGETVDILYNEENPNDLVIISDKQKTGNYIFIAVGALFVMLGILKFLQYV